MITIKKHMWLAGRVTWDDPPWSGEQATIYWIVTGGGDDISAITIAVSYHFQQLWLTHSPRDPTELSTVAKFENRTPLPDIHRSVCAALTTMSDIDAVPSFGS